MDDRAQQRIFEKILLHDRYKIDFNFKRSNALRNPFGLSFFVIALIGFAIIVGKIINGA
jgi:hypothetical protein